jgi:hypothetical protein
LEQGIMRRTFAGIPKVHALLVGAMLGIVLNCLVAAVAFPDPNETVSLESAAPAVPSCEPGDILLYQPDRASPIEFPCPSDRDSSTEVTAARAYLLATARPGYTMMRQGPELAIGRLHPAFAVRLANAVRAARQAGLASAGVFSAYRPPAFGIGGFVDKFHSLHTYGLAVDMHGIGGPGTPETQLWHDIAAQHGVVCPYGPDNPGEWNHCQPTRIKIILAENPLRETVSAQGPISLEDMFVSGTPLIAGSAAASTAEPPAHAFKPQPRVAAARIGSPSARQAGKKTAHDARALRARRTASKVVPPRYPQLVRPQPIYMEEGRRNQRGIGVVAVVLPSTSRSTVRAR